jgi:arsenate reductase (glutaredoxin)
MAREYVLWFDARSSECLRALELLRAHGVEPELRRHLEEPPSPAELRQLLERLRLPAHAVLRADEDEAQVLRLSERTPEDELVEAIAAHPRILDRPIVVGPGGAVVARPPERLLALLPGEEAAAELPDEPGPDDVFQVPITGTLDLHAFAPADVDSLVPEWLGACAEAGLRELRIVHGKGIGALRERVHALLGRDPRVASFRLAGEDGGGWGATLVRLK